MTSGVPQTAKEAALRLLMGEMSDLFDKASAIADTLTECHGFISADIQGFGKKVFEWEHSIDQVMQQVTYLIDQAKRPVVTAAPVAVAKSDTLSPKKLMAMMVLSSFIGGAIAVGGMLAFNYSTLENARIGKAVKKSLPYLDPESKRNLEQAIQKASS